MLWILLTRSWEPSLPPEFNRVFDREAFFFRVRNAPEAMGNDSQISLTYGYQTPTEAAEHLALHCPKA